MEKPSVERERVCERACGMYLVIVRRTLVRERVVIWCFDGQRDWAGWVRACLVLGFDGSEQRKSMRRLRVSLLFARKGDVRCDVRHPAIASRAFHLRRCCRQR